MENKVEEKAKVKVKINDKEFPISNDSPDLKSILTYVIEKPDLELEKELTIISEADGFDSETFKKSLVTALSETIDNIRINKEKFDVLIKKDNTN